MLTEVPDDFDFMKMLRMKHDRLWDMGLNETHFDKMMCHLVETMQDMGIDSNYINEMERLLSPLRIVFEEGRL